MKLSTLTLLVTVGILAVTAYLSWEKRKSYDEQISNLEEEFNSHQEKATAAKKDLANKLVIAEKEKEALLGAYRKLLAKGRDLDLEIAAIRDKGESVVTETKLIINRVKESQELNPQQKKIKFANSIAKVVAFSEKHAFVILDGGENRGLERGMKFALRRDHFILGRIEIDSVDESSSVANVALSTVPVGFTIRKGDAVIMGADAGIF